MTKVKLRYFASIREALGRQGEEAVVKGDRVADVVNWLVANHGDKLIPSVLNSRGELQGEYRILHNGSIASPGKMTKKIADGDEIVLLPPVAGG